VLTINSLIVASQFLGKHISQLTTSTSQIQQHHKELKQYQHHNTMAQIRQLIETAYDGKPFPKFSHLSPQDQAEITSDFRAYPSSALLSFYSH
jgi:hypothetical protein